jgi:bacteriocin-like protein
MNKKELTIKELKKVTGGAMAQGENKVGQKHGGKRHRVGHVTDPPRDAGTRPVVWKR